MDLKKIPQTSPNLSKISFWRPFIQQSIPHRQTELCFEHGHPDPRQTTPTTLQLSLLDGSKIAMMYKFRVLTQTLIFQFPRYLETSSVYIRNLKMREHYPTLSIWFLPDSTISKEAIRGKAQWWSEATVRHCTCPVASSSHLALGRGGLWIFWGETKVYFCF